MIGDVKGERVLVIDKLHHHYHKTGTTLYTEHHACGWKIVIRLDDGTECWADVKQLQFLDYESLDELSDKLFNG